MDQDQVRVISKDRCQTNGQKIARCTFPGVNPAYSTELDSTTSLGPCSSLRLRISESNSSASRGINNLKVADKLTVASLDNNFIYEALSYQ